MIHVDAVVNIEQSVSGSG